MSTLEEFNNNIDLDYYRKYFPKNVGWHYPSSMDNMIKQWYSIQSVFNYMNSFSTKYDHVGMFRVDLIYETPIYLNDEDAIQPNFGHVMPQLHFMNDRFFHGSFNASKHWSLRFSYVEKFLKEIKGTKDENRGLHSETFLYYLMKDYLRTTRTSGEKHVPAGRMCASRVRNDCRLKSPYDCKGFFGLYEVRNVTVDGVIKELVVKKGKS